MKFGVREIANVVFRAKSPMKIGNTYFQANQPVLYIDSAKTSTLEGAATTVYAQGGRGNTRLIAWEGEKTLTFTVEDALLSPIGFSILSGAGLIKENKNSTVHVHVTSYATVVNGVVEAPGKVCKSPAPIFVMGTEADGSLDGEMYDCTVGDYNETRNVTPINVTKKDKDNQPVNIEGDTVMVDCYVLKAGDAVSELQIDAEHFGGYFYVEADTLFRRQDTGKDMPANLTLPNVKIQSNFTFNMASTGDPSTFTFTMDAMPGYTYFDNTKKVLCVIQVIDENIAASQEMHSVMGCEIKDDKDNVVRTGIHDELIMDSDYAEGNE